MERLCLEELIVLDIGLRILIDLHRTGRDIFERPAHISAVPLVCFHSIVYHLAPIFHYIVYLPVDVAVDFFPILPLLFYIHQDL